MEELLRALRNTTVLDFQGLPVMVKPIPDDRREGVLDPRVRDRRKRPKPPVQNVADNTEFHGIPIGQMRARPLYPTKPVHKRPVRRENLSVPAQGRSIPVRAYLPVESSGKAILYFHGGSFIGGSLDAVEHFCMAMADFANALVWSVDYRLAPEHPFPVGLDDCFAALWYLWENSGRFGVKPDRIAVSGDSAGGNLALGCALRDDRGMVGAVASVYPVTLLSDRPNRYYRFDLSAYGIQGDQELILPHLDSMKESLQLSDLCYTQNPSLLESPLASPLMADSLKGFPPTLLVTAEFDYLRLQGEAFARRLQQEGGTVRQIRYAGMDHGFVDKCGVYPQSEDCAREIAAFLEEQL